MGLIMVTHLGPGIYRITPDAPSAKSKAKAGEALEEHITSYRARGFIIRTVTSDGEPAVKAMFNQLKGENIILNVMGHGTHIPHVESAIRHLKNKARSTAFSLPFTLPSKLAPALITFVTYTANMIPKANSPDHVPAYTQFTGRIPSFVKQTPHHFGQSGYLQRPKGPASNSAAQRADYVIWLGTTRNLAGTHRCLNLSTLAEITGDKFTPAPITQDAIDRLMSLAGYPPPPAQPPTTCAPEPFLESLAPHYPLDPHRGVLSDEPASDPVPPVIVPADDIVPDDTAATLEDDPVTSLPAEMPTPEAADSHLYDVAPSEHYDVEQESQTFYPTSDP